MKKPYDPEVRQNAMQSRDRTCHKVIQSGGRVDTRVKSEKRLFFFFG